MGESSTNSRVINSRRIWTSSTTTLEFDIESDRGQKAPHQREDVMRTAASLALVLAALMTTAAQAQVNVKIGVMSDMSGLYADLGGPGSVVAAKMAVDDFNPAAHGMKVEIVSADMLN